MTTPPTHKPDEKKPVVVSQGSTGVNKAPTPFAKPKPAAPAPTQELEEVREILIGSDLAQQRLRKPEADRLREIIFGAHMKEYERQFTDLRREMARVLDDLRLMQDNMSDFQKKQAKQIETLEREMRQSNDRLQTEVDRLQSQEPMLQQLMSQTRQQQMAGQEVKETTDELRKIQTQREQELRTLKNTVNENREYHERQLDALKRELRQAEDDLRDESRQASDRLNDQKTDRKALASMFLEVATRLETGSSMTGLLEGLTSPS